MANIVEFTYNEITTSLDLETGVRISMGPIWRYYKDAFGNKYEGDKYEGDKPLVSISLPHENHRIEHYTFETQSEAQDFYDKLRGKDKKETPETKEPSSDKQNLDQIREIIKDLNTFPLMEIDISNAFVKIEAILEKKE